MSEARPEPARDPAGKHAMTIVLALAAAAVLLAVDLWLKAWSQQQLANDQTVLLVPYVLAMRWVENHGAIFGLGHGMGWLFILATIIATGAIAWVFARTPVTHRFLQIALVLILAGALGNLHDRVLIGHVRDMLWLGPGVSLPFGWHWPGTLGGARDVYPWIFNLADTYLVLGIATLLARSFFVRPLESPGTSPDQD